MNSQRDIKVRFAPSPTGYLHIGSARTALFNWLYARHCGGKFMLRIEDTDPVRSKQEFLDEILDSLQWLGLDWDDAPVLQSQRLDIYRKYAKELLEKGLAYEAEGQIRDKDGNIIKDSSRITQKAIIFKVPQSKSITIHDLVHGPIHIDSSTIKDQVMIKSDGFPTYNFACAVDDASMGISHVIRGDDHISNTPKQILFYEALGFTMPEFAHAPLILGKDRSRMSKRHGATSIREYRQAGYLSQALVNFISLLGWAPGDNKEIMPRDDIIKEFDIKNVKSVNAVFDVDKLNWMNSEHIKSLDFDTLSFLMREFLDTEELKKISAEQFKKLISLYTMRIHTLSQLKEEADYFFKEDLAYTQEGILRLAQKPRIKENLAKLRNALSHSDEFTVITTEEILRNLAKELNISAGELIHPSRFILTNKTMGPGIFDLFELLGKEKVLKRFDTALNALP
ncbi:MAG: glutamate--tRNA ligase [Candidatus Omnitrophota bacterium]